MKRYEIYRNIRKRALIYGLPVSLFALMMLCIIGSLLVVIFSFSLPVILGAVVANLTCYVSLNKITREPGVLHFQKVFPRLISNKRSTGLSYEN